MAQLYVAPTYPVDNKLDTRTTNSIFFSKFSGGLNKWVFFSNFNYLFFGKLGTSLVASFCFVLSALFNHVGHVVLWITKKQMIGINTGRIVALMADKLSFWYGSVFYLPRNSVGVKNSPVKHKPSIIKFMCSFRRSPYPAITTFIDFIPKSFHEMSVTQRVYYV